MPMWCSLFTMKLKQIRLKSYKKMFDILGKMSEKSLIQKTNSEKYAKHRITNSILLKAYNSEILVKNRDEKQNKVQE